MKSGWTSRYYYVDIHTFVGISIGCGWYVLTCSEPATSLYFLSNFFPVLNLPSTSLSPSPYQIGSGESSLAPWVLGMER